MKTKLLYLFLACLCSQTYLSAQFCGMSAADQAILAQNFSTRPHQATISEAIQYVPICFIRIGKSSGALRVSERAILEAVCLLNEQYSGTNMQFYLNQHPDADDIFGLKVDSDALSNGTGAMSDYAQYRHPSALTVIVSNQLSSGGTTLGYYAPSSDLVFMKNQSLLIDNVLSHEVGHFFGLLHTYDGQLVSTDAQSFYPTGPFELDGIELELMDGSNCTTTGDLICDTPPDYHFVGDASCVYSDVWTDANGDLLTPPIHNMMSFRHCAPFEFSQGQIDRIQASLASPSRAYVQNSFSPGLANLDIPSPFLISPIENSFSALPQVNFEWESVAGATAYLLLVDITPNFFTPNAIAIVTSATSASLLLEKDSRYYWRVIPFNPLATCAANDSNTMSGTFTTGNLSNTNLLKGMHSFAAHVDQNLLRISIDASSNVDVQARLMDQMGRQLIGFFPISANAGKSQLEFPLDLSLPTGIYTLELLGQNGQQTAVQLFSN